MAKKTLKLSLKKETLRILADDQLRAVNGGADAGAVMAGAVKGTVSAPSGPTKETDGCVGFQFQHQYEYQR